MHWTKTLPTVPGLYGYREHQLGKRLAFMVFFDGLFVYPLHTSFDSETAKFNPERSSGEWLGPLPEQ